MVALLHIHASPRSAASNSRRIVQTLISHLKDMADIQVIARDLTHQPLPYPDQGFIEASLMAGTRGASNP
jgi:FMN-dependent NADH-azoreductase